MKSIIPKSSAAFVTTTFASLLLIAIVLQSSSAYGQLGGILGGGGGGGLGGGGGVIGGGANVGGGIGVGGGVLPLIPGTPGIVPGLNNQIGGVLGGQISNALGIPVGMNLGQRGTLGVAIDDRGNHLILQNVYPNSAAMRAGLQQGDAILAINGNTIDTHANLNAQLAAAAATGNPAVITVLRNGQPTTAQVSWGGALQNALNQNGLLPNLNVSQRGTLGVGIDDSQNQLLLTNIYGGSAAQRAGLQMGDQIVSINGNQVAVHSQLNAQLQAAAATGNPAAIAYLRNGQSFTTNVDLTGQAQLSALVPGLVASTLPQLNLSQRGTLGIGLDDGQGSLRVMHVYNGSAAQRGGLQVEDEIMTVNNNQVRSHDQLNMQLRTAANADGWANIGYQRNGANLMTRVNLAGKTQMKVQ